VTTQRLDPPRILAIADTWRADGHVRHADQLEVVAAEVERLREEREQAVAEATVELLAEVERLESARDAATRHAAELETILRATREERDTLETAFNNVQGYLKESLATEERLREELSESALRNDRLLNVLRGEEAMRREAETSRDRLAEALRAYVKNPWSLANLTIAEAALSSLPAREDG
jgi:chromosome segregation ATPase